MQSGNQTCRIIPEFSQHRCTYLLWPTRSDNWRLSGKPAQRDIAILANIISKYEPVKLGSNQPISLALSRNVSVFQAQYDDIWVRDTGPTFVNDDKVFAIDWQFNSWGGLFKSYKLDNQIPNLISFKESFPVRNENMVFEGGSYTTDGISTIITTEECVLDQRRNSNLSKAKAETTLLRNLGGENVVWIPQGFNYDETGGHVDNICFFANSETLFMATTSERNNPNYQRAQAALETVHTHYNKLKRKTKIIELPLPQPLEITPQEAQGFSSGDGIIDRQSGTPMCASYANSYVVNGAVMVPKFGIAQDDEAAQIIQEVLPDYIVEQIPSREFVLGGGAVHCITRDIPEVRNGKI